MNLPGPSNEAKLARLLEEAFGSEINPWIPDLAGDGIDLDVRDGRGVLLDQIRNIYWRRGRRNRMRGYPIDGFETFLWNLLRASSSAVLVHGLTDQTKRKYVIFTDPEITELIGILRFPNKRRSST